ncbi:hypothetical protein SSAG_02692 [Streptomyces sp. Mg1]|nr:hypothetical protein SSAG_02692 [Streptomyces sp. Mg1]
MTGIGVDPPDGKGGLLVVTSSPPTPTPGAPQPSGPGGDGVEVAIKTLRTLLSVELACVRVGLTSPGVQAGLLTPRGFPRVQELRVNRPP